MNLQLDSTVSYGVQKRALTTTDAERADKNPYNTYVNPGLPAGPIGNPSASAIEASQKPADGPWLFWVTVNPEHRRDQVRRDARRSTTSTSRSSRPGARRTRASADRPGHRRRPMAERAAVLGSPIAHSLSPALHTAGYRALGLDDWEYTRADVAEARAGRLRRRPWARSGAACR